MSAVVRILGIDPALRHAGWGVVDSDGVRLSFVAAGTIKTSTDGSLAARLARLQAALAEIVREWQPDEAAVEETFVNANPRSALALGQARGVCLCTPAAAGVPVSEYPANTIKKAVVGAGHAEKRQVQMMIRTLLPKAGDQPADAADALATAICHAHHRKLAALAVRAS